MALTLMTDLLYTVFLTTSLSTILLSLLKSAGTAIILTVSNSSTPDFKLAKSDFTLN